jgi:hypothetical protein
MVRECENCRRVIKGAGRRYCSYCRNAFVMEEDLFEDKDNFDEDEKDIPSSQGLSLKLFFIFLIIGIMAIFLFVLANNDKNNENVNPFENLTNDSCQYKELKETNEFMQVLYDQQGNRYENPVEAKNIAGGQGWASFDLINKIPFQVSVKVNYDLGHSGGSFWPNQEEFHDIDSLEIISIINRGSSGILWGTTSINSIKINYLSNSQLEVKSEKIYEEVCKECNDELCLNDGERCVNNSKCGSGICNIAGFCGTEKIVECAESFKNCNNESCLEIGVKKVGESYSCDFECKTNYGKEGICKISTKEKFSKSFFIAAFLLISAFIVYSILSDKKLTEIIRDLKTNIQSIFKRLFKKQQTSHNQNSQNQD